MSEQIITKRCSNCKEIKPLSKFFNKRNGTFERDCYCKVCRNKINNKYRKTKKGQQMLRRYRQSKKRKIVLKRYQKSDKGKVCQSKYTQTEKAKNLLKIRQMRYHKSNPERVKANHAVNHAVESGKLPRPDSLLCSCGKQAAQYHHHLGYEPEHWLDVIPVCKKCHVDSHY